MAKKKSKMSAWDVISIFLVVIGGINLGIKGFANIDIVELLFGINTFWGRTFYGIIGIASLYSIYVFIKLFIDKIIREK